VSPFDPTRSPKKPKESNAPISPICKVSRLANKESNEYLNELNDIYHQTDDLMSRVERTSIFTPLESTKDGSRLGKRPQKK